MSSYALKNKQDIENFVRGVTFMGTGGSGGSKLSLNFLTKALEEGCELSWVDSHFWGKFKKLKEMGLDEPTVKQPLIKADQKLEKYK